MQQTDFEGEFIRRTGKRPDQCSADELQAEIAKLQAEGEAHLKHGDELRAFGERRHWQDECKKREVAIRADFLAGYDSVVVDKIQHKDANFNPNIAAGNDWGICIVNAHSGDESISPEYLATLRAGLCEAHVASTRFGWHGDAVGATSNPYRWIAARLEGLGEKTEVAT